MDPEREFIREWFPEQDDDDFLLKIYLRSQWDESQFLRMERIAHQMLDALENDPRRRQRWHYTFTDRIASIINLLSHPGFLAENELSMTKDQYKSYIEQRINRLHALRVRYEAMH